MNLKHKLVLKFKNWMKYSFYSHQIELDYIQHYDLDGITNFNYLVIIPTNKQIIAQELLEYKFK